MIPGDWEILIASRQRARRLNVPLLKQLIGWLLAEELKLEHAQIGFHFVTAKEMARVHKDFMKIEGSTDVITFDHSEGRGRCPQRAVHGEIFISIQDAIAQAKEFKTTWQSETARYVIHAILHLLGHDDRQPAARAKMKRAENSLLRNAARRFPLAKLEKK
jgi:probable rRNA maturation factor